MSPASKTAMVKLPGGEEISVSEIMHLISTKRFSTPVHIYQEPILTEPSPNFTRGRDRFPMRELRWHSASVDNPNRYEILPGTFAKADFKASWNSQGRIIDDTVIHTIYPERMFTGIHYRIDIDPIGWEDRPLRRGDIIIFRGFNSDDIKYVVTWQRTDEICTETAYVQVNALGKDRDVVDSNDADWPSIGFYVPTNLCNVTPSPIPTIPYDPHAQVSFIDPFTSQMIPPSPQDELALHKVKRRNAQVAELPGIFNRVKRKVSPAT